MCKAHQAWVNSSVASLIPVVLSHSCNPQVLQLIVIDEDLVSFQKKVMGIAQVPLKQVCAVAAAVNTAACSIGNTADNCGMLMASWQVLSQSSCRAMFHECLMPFEQKLAQTAVH